MYSRPQRAPYPWTWLSASLAGALLNLAASLLDQPRAFDSWERLGLPLAAGFVLLLVASLPAFGLLVPFGRVLGMAPSALGAGLYTAILLASALAPLVEAGMRETSRERAAVLVLCAAGFVSCAAAATAIARARGEHERGAQALVLIPFASLALLGASWGVRYAAETRDELALVLFAGMCAAAAGHWMAYRLAPPSALGLLALAVLGLGAYDELRARPGPGADPAAATSDRPPVVLITVDTLRADRVLGESPARVPTPTLDALLADSVVFTQARTAAPWTKPAIATLLTGLSPLVHGMTSRRARLPEGVETLAERLRAAGYRTGGIGLNVHLERAFGLDQGFDDYAFPARPDLGIALGARLLERVVPERFTARFPATATIAGTAVEWIGAHAHAPFFLWLHVLDPHWPYAPPAEWLEEPAREPRAWGEPALVASVQSGSVKPGPAERERVAELYAGEIRYVDAELARVLAELRRHGLYERALIVLASDHGEEFFEHGRFEHGHTLYDEVLRVPLAFKLPGADARASVAAAVSTEALVPTVLDVLGLPFDPAETSSASLAPWWRDPASAREEPLFASGTYYFGEKRGVVFEGKKLVLELDTGRSELYDLVEDPHELRRAAASEAERQGLELLGAWQERCAQLRARLRIEDGSSADADEGVLRALRDLGYAGTQ